WGVGGGGWLPMGGGGRRSSSAKPYIEEASPSAATFSGNSAPHMPGPAIGSMRTTSALSLTAPDFRQAISASARQGSRSADWKNPRPQPANETRTTEPTRYKRTPRVIRARSANYLKRFFNTLISRVFNHVSADFARCTDSGPDFFGRERFGKFKS